MLNRDERDEKEAKDDKNVTFFRFEDLRIYHKSLDYNNWLYDVSMLYPDNDKTQLMQRFSHAARNITFYNRTSIAKVILKDGVAEIISVQTWIFTSIRAGVTSTP